MSSTSTSEDTVELFALYAFAEALTVDLDDADFEWLELNANAVTYSRRREDVPEGAWLAEGFKFEVVDQRIVSAADPRAIRSADAPVSFLLRT